MLYESLPNQSRAIAAALPSKVTRLNTTQIFFSLQPPIS